MKFDFILKTNALGVTKKLNYTDEQNELASMLKVLGHPARIAILQSIMKSNTCICGDLVTEIGLAQSTISKHLMELKMVGLIKGTLEGTSVCYCIDMTRWEELEKLRVKLLNPGIVASDNCC